MRELWHYVDSKFFQKINKQDLIQKIDELLVAVHHPTPTVGPPCASLSDSHALPNPRPPYVGK